jgi:hypothetical protein
MIGAVGTLPPQFLLGAADNIFGLEIAIESRVPLGGQIRSNLGQ